MSWVSLCRDLCGQKWKPPSNHHEWSKWILQPLQTTAGLDCYPRRDLEPGKQSKSSKFSSLKCYFKLQNLEVICCAAIDTNILKFQTSNWDFLICRSIPWLYHAKAIWQLFCSPLAPAFLFFLWKRDCENNFNYQLLNNQCKSSTYKQFTYVIAMYSQWTYEIGIIVYI